MDNILDEADSFILQDLEFSENNTEETSTSLEEYYPFYIQ